MTIEQLKQKSRKAFAAYWDMNKKLSNAIAANDMQKVCIYADDMANLLKEAATAQMEVERLEQEQK